MLEALWSVEFRTNAGYAGAGVAVFETGRIFGGDGQYFYIGTYTITYQHVVANLRVRHYSGPLSSVFGPLKEVNLALSGDVAEKTFNVMGRAKEAPGEIFIRLTHRADLP